MFWTPSNAAANVTLTERISESPETFIEEVPTAHWLFCKVVEAPSRRVVVVSPLSDVNPTVPACGLTEIEQAPENLRLGANSIPRLVRLAAFCESVNTNVKV